MSDLNPEKWLDREDVVARNGRLERLKWMSNQMPKVNWMIFGCGPTSKYLFEEARYSFAYGQFLASIMLGMAFIELSLAGAFYGSGRNDLQKTGIADLTKEALNYGWLNKDEFEALNRIRKLRNPITHFRPPGHDERIETRAYMEKTDDYDLIERDAYQVMQTLFKLFTKIVPFAYHK